MAARKVHSPDEDYLVEVATTRPEDNSAGYLVETINVRELDNWHCEVVSNGNRSQLEEKKAIGADMSALLRRHSHEGTRIGDLSSITVQYVRKHGIPGRRYAVGPSIQKLKRIDRESAFTTYCHASGGDSCVFVDIDLNKSMPQIFWNEASDVMGDDDARKELDMIQTYLENSSEWLNFLERYADTDRDGAKKMILKLFFLGVPETDLPFLWKLSTTIRAAADVLLSNPKFAYLADMFQSRRNPTASRLHYALAAKEDEILSMVETALKDAMPDAAICTYMFDGAILRMKRDSMHKLDTVLQQVGERFNVTFKKRVFRSEVL